MSVIFYHLYRHICRNILVLGQSSDRITLLWSLYFTHTLESHSDNPFIKNDLKSTPDRDLGLVVSGELLKVHKRCNFNRVTPGMQLLLVILLCDIFQGESVKSPLFSYFLFFFFFNFVESINFFIFLTMTLCLVLPCFARAPHIFGTFPSTLHF